MLNVHHFWQRLRWLRLRRSPMLLSGNSWKAPVGDYCHPGPVFHLCLGRDGV